VQRAVDIEKGKEAVKHYERMGMIQFPEKTTRRDRFVETYNLTQEDKRKAAQEASERTLNGEKIGAVCFELGFDPQTVKKWCKKFGYSVPKRNKPRKTVTPEQLAEVIRLVNEESYRMTQASAKVGHSLAAISHNLAGIGYIYDKQKVQLIKAD
jgi:transposase-like protein